jgi:hypothetical protein
MDCKYMYCIIIYGEYREDALHTVHNICELNDCRINYEQYGIEDPELLVRSGSR